MGWLSLLLTFIKDFFVSIVVEEMKTPAKETEVKETDGKADSDIDRYSGYGGVS